MENEGVFLNFLEYRYYSKKQKTSELIQIYDRNQFKLTYSDRISRCGFPSLIGPAQLDLAEWSHFSSFSVKLWKVFSEAELQKQFQRLSWSSVGETEEYPSCVS